MNRQQNKDVFYGPGKSNKTVILEKLYRNLNQRSEKGYKSTTVKKVTYYGSKNI